MVRILIGIGLVFGCTGLPVQAKGLAPVIPAPPVKTDKSTASSKPASPVKAPMPKTTAPVVAKAAAVKQTPALASSTLNNKHRSSGCSTRTCASRNPAGHLARLTAYWAGEGDYYTGHGLSSTGIRLHDGHCAVDPRIIPYGSVVTIPGVGKYLAVDTGSAVISREAARESGHTPEERSALVIDLYFESRVDGEKFEASASKYASITWEAPNQANSMTSDVKDLIAESDWNKLRNKQL